MSKFQEQQRAKQVQLIRASNIFNSSKGGGYFMGDFRDFVLKESIYNLYEPIRKDILKYMSENNISWWGGNKPTGHTLSSQIACFNHLFYIRNDKDIVLNILNNVKNEFIEVLPIPCDKEDTFISFEVVSGEDYLNEKQSTRGTNCTSIDAFIYARHNSGEIWLIPIEWKYTEHYNNQDKSTEDSRGDERLRRYMTLIKDSKQLKSLDEYKGSVYFQEPFYQLMRQTLWAEQVIAHKDSEKEPLKADNYLHIHVIPNANKDLLNKAYKVTGNSMENSWKAQLEDDSKYIIVDPADLIKPIKNNYGKLYSYIKERY